MLSSSADDLPDLQGVQEALGCLYVVEGSTLGGQVIARHLRQTLGVDPRCGGSFFARTRPEIFNADTLSRDFRLSSGDLIVAGQETPLTRFSDGSYRLAITVTDRVSGRSLTRDVLFTIAGP